MEYFKSKYQIHQMKLSSRDQPAKLRFAKWFTVNKLENHFLIGNGLNMIDKYYLKMISK